MIGIFHAGVNNNTGPGKVASNLITGLRKLGHDVVENEEGDYTGCLASWSPRFKDLPRNTLVGPNLVVLPTDDLEIWNLFDHLIVPCDWVEDYFNKFNCTKKTNLHKWAVGIDTDKFSPRGDKEIDCLIYFKNRSQQELNQVISTLNDKGFSHVVIKYGDYTEDTFIDVVRKCKFSIVLSSTESQGIAYQEILSMGVPCYIIDKHEWNDRPGYSFPATSAPFFDNRCGIKCSDLSFFGAFLYDLNKFSPRDYILDNLTLEKCAGEYFNIMEKIGDIS